MNPFIIVLLALAALLITLLLLLFLGRASIRVSFYGQLRVVLSVLGLRFRIYPDKGGSGVDSKIFKKLNKKRKQQSALKKSQRSAGTPTPNLLENLQMVFAVVRKAYNRVCGKLRIRVRRFLICVATGDAAQTALLYGTVLSCSSLFLQWVNDCVAPLERKDGAMEITTDYLAKQSTAELDIQLGMRIWSALTVTFALLSDAKQQRKLAYDKAARRAAKKKSRKNQSV